MSIDISQFFQAFFDEAEELLAEKERLLLALDLAAPDAEELNAVFRTAHSIKGGASTFGLTDMTDVTHVLESLLDRIRKGEMALTSEHVDAFLAAKDVLKMQLDGHRHGAPVDQEAVADVRMVLQALLQQMPVGAAKAAAIGFIRNLSGEVGRHGVTVNAVSLGTMNNWEGSEQIARKTTTVGRAGSPQDVGAAISFLVSPQSEWINGQVLPVNGGSLVA